MSHLDGALECVLSLVGAVKMRERDAMSDESIGKKALMTASREYLNNTSEHCICLGESD
jgi:hypothetical protein